MIIKKEKYNEIVFFELSFRSFSHKLTLHDISLTKKHVILNKKIILNFTFIYISNIQKDTLYIKKNIKRTV